MLVSTSRNPTASARRFAKLITHITNGTYFNRGKSSLQMLFDHALDKHEQMIIIVSEHPESQSYRVNVFEVKGIEIKKLEQEAVFSHIIDYKIYGWKNLPGHAPISTGAIVREQLPELSAFFQRVFGMIVGQKTQIWMQVDVFKDRKEVVFIDPTTMRPFFSAKVRLT